MPGGAILIDTPGLRELQVWEGDIDSAFADIAELAAQCRFNDCAHTTEPDCAVQEALETGELDAGRWANYVKLQRELRSIEARERTRVQRELKQPLEGARSRDAARPPLWGEALGARYFSSCVTQYSVVGVGGVVKRAFTA